MKSLFHPEFLKILYGFWYRFRFLGLYTVIGLFSLLLELAVRSQLKLLGVSEVLATIFSLTIGILFAFFGNTFLNFQVPPARRNRALFYFVAISLFSGALQWSVVGLLDELIFSYEEGRLIISGCLFMIAYFLHRRFTFRDFKRVGVAIYANGVEDLRSIHERIGQYPDFIHVDIVDPSFAPDSLETKTFRMETVRALWPNKEIHTHIMSKTPTKWLNEILPYSDTVFVHWECNESLDNLIMLIRSENVRAGVALTMETTPKQAVETLKNVDSVLLLTIPDPGKSGQKFELEGLDRIEQLTKMPFREKLRICVDGGVNEKIAALLKVEDVVSGSSVLNHSDPKHQILRLQTAGRYELL